MDDVYFVRRYNIKMIDSVTIINTMQPSHDLLKMELKSHLKNK